jgi:HAT1-interacting factor 1
MSSADAPEGANPPVAEATTTANDAPVAAPEASAAAAAEAAGADQTVEDDVKSKKVTLADLSAKGAALFAHKKYEEASEVFSEASNLQAEINGETAPENAEILFHYGRSLFKVGQSKSNVLGGAAPAEKKPAAETNGKAKKAKQAEAAAGTAASSSSAAAAGSAGTTEPAKVEDDAGPKKPLFQFTGDENFDDSDDEDEVISEPLKYAAYICFATWTNPKIGSRRRRRRGRRR